MNKITLFTLTILLASATISNAIPLYDIWHDTDFDGIKDTYLGTVSSYSGSISSVANYGYSSFSAHPSDGPTPEAYKSKMYLYDGSDGLSLGFFHNIDGGGNKYWNHVQWEFKYVNMTASIGLVDDSSPEDQGEVGIVSSGADTFDAGWAYRQNTDGGVFNNLVPTASDWEIHITPQMFGDIREWQMYSGDDSYVSLWTNPEPLPSISDPDTDYYGPTSFRASTAIITPHAIPEPGTLILISTGLIGVGLIVRHRRK